MDMLNRQLQHLICHRWLLVKNISTPALAVAFTQAIAARYAAKTIMDPPVLRAPATEIMSLFGQGKSRTSPTGPVFRALHFAGGLPLAARRASTSTVRLVALYCSAGTPACDGKIRLVPVEQLLPVCGSARDARRAALMMQQDALPQGQSEIRRVCLASLLADVAPEVCGGVIMDDPARIFGDDQLCALTRMAKESSFFAGHGVDLSKNEHRLELNGGNLLLIDNLRCASGYIGTPPKSAWFECLIGTNGLMPSDVSAIRAWWGSRLGRLIDADTTSATDSVLRV